MTASQMRIAETIDAFYGDAGTKDGVSRSYKQAVEDLDAESLKARDGPYMYDTIISNRVRRLTDLLTQSHRPRTDLPLLRVLPRHQ
jgi:hypothetical protein